MAKIQERGKISPFKAIANFFKGYFNFRGRTKRGSFWWTVLFLYFAALAFAFLFYTFQLTLEFVFSFSQSILFNPILYVIFLILCGIMIPFFAMLSRRLIDTAMKERQVFLWLCGLLSILIFSLVFQIIESPFANYMAFMLSFFFFIAFFIFSLLPSDYFLEAVKIKAETKEKDEIKEKAFEESSESIPESEKELTETASEAAIEDSKAIFRVHAGEISGLQGKDMVEKVSELANEGTNEALENKNLE